MSTPEQIYSFTFTELGTFVSGCGAVIAAVVTGIWVFTNRQLTNLNEQLTHWKEQLTERKEMYEAKARELADSRKENEELKAHPEKLAMNFISQSEKVTSGQIKRLMESVEALKADCAAKELEIKNLTATTKLNDDQLVHAKEQKENLERKVKAYEEIINQLRGRLDRAKQTSSAFKSGEFDVDGLDTKIDEEIRKKIKDINASSFSKTSARTRDAARLASSKAEAKASREMREKLAAIKDVEERAEKAMRVKVPLDVAVAPRTRK